VGETHQPQNIDTGATLKSMPRPPQTRTDKALLGVLCYSAAAYSATGIGLVELQRQADISTRALGLVGVAGLAAGLAGELLLAPSADRGRTRTLAVLSAAMTTTALLVLAFAGNLAAFAAGKALIGASLGIAAPLVMGSAARENENKGRALAATVGLQMAAHSLGAFLAAGGLGAVGVTTTFAGLGTLGIGVTALAGRLRNTATTENERPPRLAFDLLKNRRMTGALLLAVAFNLATGVNGTLWDRHVTDTVATSGHDPNLVNGLTYLAWTVTYLVSVRIGGKIADRTSGQGHRYAHLPVAATAFTYGLAFGPISIVGASALNGAAEGLLWPMVLLGIVASVPANRSGAAQSLSHACISLGGLLVAGVAPLMYDAVGAAATYAATAATMVVLGTSGALLLATGRKPEAE